INQMRAFCLEYGVPLRQGAGMFKLELPRALNDEGNDLSPMMRRLLGDLFADLRRLEERIREVTKEIEAVADREDVTRRLMTIPGIGALGATAVLAAIGDGLQFRKARDLAAWLGLVPRQYSTGGKQTLLGVSKRGNRYVRKLLVHGARSFFRHLDRTRDRLGSWLDGLQARMHPNKAVVALAAKMARIVWVVLNKPGALYERRDPAFT
ncbi:IS110 family transposase, partial [Bradyrhizobium japonicum]|uniref:IS110 family transposase n=1 Tax=Bradyrhizobium japonicum TaxID=375 RepID=UPI0005777310